MKKAVVFSMILFVVAVAFSSCKSTQDCPAYSKVETVTSNHA